ncbi:MAG: Tfp pilus assembly protein FimT/FimU [Acutalibacteraceae bacterium]
MFTFMKKKLGFTLVELLVVIVILAIVTVIAIPIYSNVTEKNRIKICKTTQREVTSEVKNWCNVNNWNDDYDFAIINDDGTGKIVNYVTTHTDAENADLEEKLFRNNVPSCPGNGVITVQTIKNTDGIVKIKVACDGGSDGDVHK